MRISSLPLLCVCVCLTSPATIQENGPAVIRVVVAEGGDAILPCSLSTRENIEQTLFDWKKDDQKEVFFYEAGHHYSNRRDGQDEQFKGRVFHFQDELKHGDASIKIKNTKISDSGKYTCDFPRLPNGQTFYIELVVGAARKPYIRTNVTEDGLLLLQCDVLGASPKPEVEWQDSAGNILHAEEPQVINRGDRYDVTLLTTVTRSDHFHCVVKQKEVNHEISAEIYVSVPEKHHEVWVGWLGGLVLGAAVTAVLLQTLLVFTKCIAISRKKGSPQQMNCSCNGYSQVPLKTQPEP